MSTQSLRPISSVITGVARAARSSTGMQRGETGYADHSHSNGHNDLYLPTPPVWLRQTVKDSTNYLVSSILRNKRPPDGVSVEQAKLDLSPALHDARRAQAPASLEEIAGALEGIAQVFRASLPEKTGLKIYISVLQDLPRVAFKEACRDVVRTHKYPNMPLPSQFIEAAETPKERIVFWLERLENANKLLTRIP